MKKTVLLLLIVNLSTLFAEVTPDFLTILEKFNSGRNIIIYTSQENPKKGSGNKRRGNGSKGRRSETGNGSNKNIERPIIEDTFIPELYEVTGHKTGEFGVIDIWIVDIKSIVDEVNFPIKISSGL